MNYNAYLLVALAVCAASLDTFAVTINATLTSKGGDSYQYDYEVVNDGTLAQSLELFDIYFDPSLYKTSSLSIVLSEPTASEWEQSILGSGIGLPAAFDALSITGGIPIGERLSGFVVDFTWIGAGMPSTQEFDVLDALTFDVLASGSTVVSAVPLPAALPLFLIGLLLVPCACGGFRAGQRAIV